MGKDEFERDGGPAFPVSAHMGASLRDLFAMGALQGLLASPKNITIGDQPVNTAELVGEAAYVYADAMLAARKTKFASPLPPFED